MEDLMLEESLRGRLDRWLFLLEINSDAGQKHSAQVARKSLHNGDLHLVLELLQARIMRWGGTDDFHFDQMSLSELRSLIREIKHIQETSS